MWRLLSKHVVCSVTLHFKFFHDCFQDTDMLYEPTNTPAMARTSNLNEELGQVYIYIYFILCTYLKEISFKVFCFSFLSGEVHFLRQDRNSHLQRDAVQEMHYCRCGLWVCWAFLPVFPFSLPSSSYPLAFIKCRVCIIVHLAFHSPSLPSH